MPYINTKYIYDLFENGIAHLHVTDIDKLPRKDAYNCLVEFDNGATVSNKVVIVFTENVSSIPSIIYDALCKHSDESIRSMKVNKIDIENDAFIIIDK